MRILIDSQYRPQDPLVELENLRRLNLPIPAELTKANSFFNPLGQAPARGYFLLLRRDLNRMNLNGYHTISIRDDAKRTVSITNVLISKEPAALTAGKDADENCCYMVEFSDKRHLLSSPFLGVAINKQYNVTAPAWGRSGATQYHAHSLNAGSAWTWQTMVSNIWGLMSHLGSAPTLPVTPDGTPENWKFVGVDAWTSLCQVLWRIGCAVQWDPGNDSYSIVQVGTASAATDAAIAAAERTRQIYTRDYVDVALARVPGTIRVFFHREYEHYGTEQTTPRTDPEQWLATPCTSIDVASGVTGADANVVHPLWDDLTAQYDVAGSLTNSSALNIRALERAADYTRMVRYGTRNQSFYTGLVQVIPSGTVRGVAWRMDLLGIGLGEPGGLMTEVIRHPWAMLSVAEGHVASPFECWSAENSTKIISPDFRPTYPVYPHLLQVVRTVSGPDGDGRYDAYVQQYNPATGTLSDKEQVWVRNLNP